MHKRILLAEPSETIRSVASAVLRQNGYEVISVSTVAKGLEVLNYSRPDVILANGALAGEDDRPFHERVKGDARFSSIPMLLLHEPARPALPFPDEVVIRLPFDPKELLDRVSVFAGRSSGPRPANPLSGHAPHDELIDEALGLDSIEVTDSKVMDKTAIIRTGKPPAGMGDSGGTKTELGGTGRVETIIIQDDATDIRHKTKGTPRPADLSASAKLDILTDADQYEVEDKVAPEHTDTAHDYEWFVSEMQKEAQGAHAPGKPAHGPTESKPGVNDSAKLRYTDTASHVDPVTPPPASAASRRTQASGAVEKFIDEFRREIEKVRSGEPDSILLEAEPPAAPAHDAGLGWEDSIEQLTGADLEPFTREFARALAEKLAEKLISKIDNEKLLAMVKAELVSRAGQRTRR